ncbi:MAG TPA: DUF3568 family protein [Gemmatimonadales bacterium]|nr:DUF3568 family protein [Gemmatimonadales bacterium]
MRRTNTTRSWAAASAAALLLAGCVVAAAGAGAGGGIYLTQRGVESVVPATVERAAAATNQAFDQLKVRPVKSQVEQGEDGEKREIEGAAGDREVSVTLKTEGTNATRVQVVVKRTAVTWDKDFARSVLDKIVANSR